MRKIPTTVPDPPLQQQYTKVGDQLERKKKKKVKLPKDKDRQRGRGKMMMKKKMRRMHRKVV